MVVVVGDRVVGDRVVEGRVVVVVVVVVGGQRDHIAQREVGEGFGRKEKDQRERGGGEGQ